MNRSALRVSAAIAAFALLAVAGLAQSPNCGILQGAAETSLPNLAGTLPPSGDMSLGGGSSYLYVLTQWGLARASLANPANPGPYSQVVLSSDGGGSAIIPLACDCHQGWNTMSVAEGPSGNSRMVGDWQPYVQGGPAPPPPNSSFSGHPAMVNQTVGSSAPIFGQQINLSARVPNGSRIASIYAVPSQKYFGYFPVKGAGVYVADVTAPSGSPSYLNPIEPTFAIAWSSPSASGQGARINAAHVTVPAYDKYLLVGATSGDSRMHVAEINTSSGTANEVASAPFGSMPDSIDVGVVNGRIFIFSAEGNDGTRVYEFQPPNVLMAAGTIAGDSTHVIVRGPQPFPALFILQGAPSVIEIYDTKWLTQGGAPLLAKTIAHGAASDGAFIGEGFEALVQQQGASVIAYLYRELSAPPPGLPAVQSKIHTRKIDISCIAADPTAPPVANAVLTNLSAAARPSPENTKSYYGDKWSIEDFSVSFQPLTNIQWDIITPGPSGPFAADAAWSGTPTAALTDINPAYWPCDPAAAGNLTTGANCWQSLGSPQSGTYYLGLKTSNVNGPSPAFFSSGSAVLAPQLSIVGYSGNVLQVLAGNPNNGDASASQGNTSEATFAWTFTPSGSAVGAIVNIPTTATAFSLTTTYKGGYATTKSGSVQQVDLVPNFSVSPNPVLKSTPITVRNLMQKAAAAVVVTVSYSINAVPPSSDVLASSFWVTGGSGTAPVTAPATAGNYTMTLTYSYTDHNGNPQVGTVAKPFSVTAFSPNPSVMVCTNNTVPCSQPAPFFNNFSLTQGTTYYLSDSETLPGGFVHPGASFYTSTNSTTSTTGDTLIGSSTGAGPVTFPASALCTSSCFMKVSVSGAVGVIGYTVTSGGGGGGGGGGTPTLTLSGPTSGTTAAAVTFSATTSNFPGAVTFTWDFGDTPSGGGGGGGGGGGCPPILACVGTNPEAAVAAPSDVGTSTHTYVNTGTHTVRVTANAGSQTLSRTASITIVQGGPPQPSNGYTVTGAVQNTFNGNWEVEAGRTVTFSATEIDANVAATDAFAWNFGDGSTALGRTVTHAFGSPGIKAVTLVVTGDGVNRVGTSPAASIRFDVQTPSFQAIMIPGAGSIESESGTWATDISVTNPGTANTTITLYFAAFSDAITGDLSALPFDSLNSIPLSGGQSWSGIDVIGDPEILNRGGDGKGILFLKYDGGNATPIVTARVYFTAQGSSYGTALPSFVVGPYGQTQAQGIEATTGQTLTGLRNDSLYRFNVSLFNASSEGGQFHVDAFSEDGAQVGSRDFSVLPYSQAGVNDTDLISGLDPSKRYVLKATGTSGALQAYASQLDRRNNDLVQVADDTPRQNVPPGTLVNYYMSGVGRIEDATAHWRTDVRFFNPSTLQRTVFLEYHYTPAGSTIEQIVLAPLTVGAGQGISLDDIVGNYLDDFSPADLKTGTILGLLKVYYFAPTDIVTAPLIIGGRIYADLPTGTAGMQLAVYTQSQSVPPGNQVLVMPGAQANLRFRTNIGLFTLGDLPTTVRISAVRQDGVVMSTYDYQLNNPGQTGAYAQIPMTALPSIDGNPMTIKVQSVSGSPVAAYIVTVDQISSDTVFIQGKPIS